MQQLCRGLLASSCFHALDARPRRHLAAAAAVAAAALAAAADAAWLGGGWGANALLPAGVG